MKIRAGICLIPAVLIFLSACSYSADIGAKRQVTSYSEKSYELNKALDLDIESDSSNMEFYSWKRNEVKFEITRVVRGLGEADDLQKKLDNFNITSNLEGNLVVFKSSYKGGVKNPADRSVDLKVYLPKRLKKIKIKLDMGKVKFYDDITGELNIGMSMANIDINRLEGKIELKGDMGDLTLGDGRLTGESSVRVNMGNISIRSAYDVIGSSVFETNLGNIEILLPADTQANIESSGNLKQNDFKSFNSPSRIKVKSGMGRIDIKKY